MATTTGMTRNQNHDYAYNRKKFKACDNGGVAPSSGLNYDVLLLVMMKLGVGDFFACSGVCKSWRSLALSNKENFMACRPPMLIWIKYIRDEEECYCCLEDIEGRKFKTLLPHSSYIECAGLTCGYLVLLSRKYNDCLVVNPITRHVLQFPFVPFHVDFDEETTVRVILIFSPSISGWVFVMANRLSQKIWFCIAGKIFWNHVSSTYPILDLHAFKGKIYTLNTGCHVYEMSLSPKPKLTLLEIKNWLKPRFFRPKLVSSCENLYVIDCVPKDIYRVCELDLGKLKWVLLAEKTMEEYVFFLSVLRNGAAFNGATIKLNSLADDPQSQYKRYDCFPDTTQKDRKGLFTLHLCSYLCIC